MHIPEVCSHPQIFCTNFGIELKMLGFKIILEICFHPQMFGTNLGKELKILGFLHILEICFQPPNVWHKYREGIKKKNYTSQKYVSTPQIFGANIRTEVKMLGFIHILEICFHPPNIWHKYQDRSENVGFCTHPRNMFPPPNVLLKFRERIKNVGFVYTSQKYVSTPQIFGTNIRIEVKMLVFFTHPRNMFPPPNCLA